MKVSETLDNKEFSRSTTVIQLRVNEVRVRDELLRLTQPEANLGVYLALVVQASFKTFGSPI